MPKVKQKYCMLIPEITVNVKVLILYACDTESYNF